MQSNQNMTKICFLQLNSLHYSVSVIFKLFHYQYMTSFSATITRVSEELTVQKIAVCFIDFLF